MSSKIIIFTSNNSVQKWQVNFAIWSIRRVDNNSEIIVLDSQDNEGKQFENYDATHIRLPNYALEYRKGTGDSGWGGNPNKLYAIEYLCNMSMNENTNLLLLDPDMVFNKNFEISTEIGVVSGQHWMGTSDMLMIPFIIKLKDLRTISPEYTSESIRIRRETDSWMSDMYAFDTLFKKYLKSKPVRDLGIPTDWHSGYESIPEPKIIHYCGNIKDYSGNVIWTKSEHNKNPTKFLDYSNINPHNKRFFDLINEFNS